MSGYGQCTLIPLHSRPHEVEECDLEVGFSCAAFTAQVRIFQSLAGRRVFPAEDVSMSSCALSKGVLSPVGSPRWQ